ncbi:hypothetical protein [Paenibacillus tengchongensis]|uniref:hypothetical protein n=1 Tax=Paenibacillus tengchongensis TaxID=2608684 RepID=UPI00124CA882|nr:hypothetical protein [Paenibacillus tengchongensis]
MSIQYNTNKDIPCEQLHALFKAVGWSDGTETSHFPDSEWLVGTTTKISRYYEKLGFSPVDEVYLRIPSKWF